MAPEFKFELNEQVVIEASGETGYIIGRAEYSESMPAYLIRYKAADGRAVEAWWTGRALRPQ